MRTPTQRLRELGIELPQPLPPRWSYVPVTIQDGIAYVSGQVPWVDGELRVRGRVGAEVDLDTARDQARTAILNALAQLDVAAGGLDRVERILKVTGFVSSAPEFFEQPRVIDAASELLEQVFGERGRHARSAIGVAALPSNVPVEIELVAAIAPTA